MTSNTLEIFQSDNITILNKLESNSIDLIYIDPPFNTGKVQSRTRIKTKRSLNGDRIGFKGYSYKTEILGEQNYKDIFDDYIGFLEKRILESKRILKREGSFFLHLDYREIHYAKILCDKIFGRESFVNEIIWSYDYGARSKKKWSTKHDNILWYAMNPKKYTFNYDSIDRIPYMAPGLVGPEKAAKGKPPTDSWWQTIVSPNSREKTGYPTQKPIAIMNRIIKVHSNENDKILDFFAGSGSTGEAAIENNRNAILIDNNPQAISTMKNRFKNHKNVIFYENL
ncbi:MAG: site-specific DNA-methyltransferase [Dehalococcoidia bacterium]|nr:site-specific DNA-methyltransferase [Dehalococcoidia bacterium]